MIIVDGFNVYPSEVEGVLYQHPAVRLAAVIGVPHRYHGEVVKACIVLRDGMSVTNDELDAHCAASLAEYKRPRQIECRDNLPMSAVGKILYRVLRDELRQAAPGSGDARWPGSRLARTFRRLASSAQGTPAADDRAARLPPASKPIPAAWCSPRCRHRRTTTAWASSTAAWRRRCSTRRLAAPSTPRRRPARRLRRSS